MSEKQRIIAKLSRLYRLRDEGHNVNTLIRSLEGRLWTKGVIDKEMEAKKALEARSRKKKESLI